LKILQDFSLFAEKFNLKRLIMGANKDDVMPDIALHIFSLKIILQSLDDKGANDLFFLFFLRKTLDEMLKYMSHAYGKQIKSSFLRRIKNTDISTICNTRVRLYNHLTHGKGVSGTDDYKQR